MSASQASPNTIARRITFWFADHARDLPWRRTLDPYAVWISEIMLQQTQVATVIPYFDRWMKAAPDVLALSRLSSTRLHKLWEGLGYYTRARNLQKAARQVMEEHGGEFPRDHAAILSLCGIGRYTAGAISSIAFNEPQPIVDGNVIRVLSRLHGIEGNPRDKRAAEIFWDSAASLVAAAARMRTKPRPANRMMKFAGNCSLLNQGLMELGATTCTTRSPKCNVCPVRNFCHALRTKRISEFPQLPVRSAITARRFIALIVSHRDRIYVCQRPDGAVNAHLWELPNVEVPLNDGGALDKALSRFGLNGARTEHVHTIKHSITRYRIQTECHRVMGNRSIKANHVTARARAQLKKLPFTSAHRQLLDWI